MSRAAYTARIAAATIALIGAVLVLVLVWGLRPTIPHLEALGRGQSVTPVLEQAGVGIAWLVAVGLLVSGIARTLTAITHSEPPRHRRAATRLNDVLAVNPRRSLSVRHMPHRERVRSYSLVLQVLGAPHADFTVKRSPDEPGSQEHIKATQTAERSISLLGPLTIQGARQRGRRMRSLTIEMLVYLALHSEGATVERLADTLLPNTDYEKARGRLWQSATEAKRVLGESFHRDGHGRYQLDRDTIRVDLDELNQLLDAAGSAATPEAEAQHLERALELFQGEPLAGTDLPWAESHARQLRMTYVDLLEQVGRSHLTRGDARGALGLAERGLDIDKLNEGLWRLTMEADFAVGLRDSVSQRYQQLRDLLGRELGLEPTGQTRVLYHRLLGQG